MALAGQERKQLAAHVSSALKTLWTIGHDLDEIVMYGTEEEYGEFINTLHVYLKEFVDDVVKSIQVLGKLYATALLQSDAFDYLHRLRKWPDPEARKVDQAIKILEPMPEEIRKATVIAAKQLRKRLEPIIKAMKTLPS